MGFIILAAGVLVLGIIGVILIKVFGYRLGLSWDTRDKLNIVSGFLIIVGVIGLLATVPMAIIVNNPTYVANELYSLKEKVKLYENEKTILLSYHVISDKNQTALTSDLTLETISTDAYWAKVTTYNEKIYDFKVDCIEHKNNRRNFWIGLFESAAWDSISEEYLESLTYTVGK